LPFDATGHHLVNARIALMKVVKVRTFVASGVVAVTMGAVHDKQVTSFRDLGR
jgi:hypothetical protein